MGNANQLEKNFWFILGALLIIVGSLLFWFFLVSPKIDKVVAAIDSVNTTGDKVLAAKDKLITDLGDTESDLRRNLEETIDSSGQTLVTSAARAVRRYTNQYAEEQTHLYGKDSEGNTVLVVNPSKKEDRRNDKDDEGNLLYTGPFMPSETVQAVNGIFSNLGKTKVLNTATTKSAGKGQAQATPADKKKLPF